MDFYKYTCESLEYITEEAFYRKFEEFKIGYKNKRNTLNSITSKWVGIESQ